MNIRLVATLVLATASCTSGKKKAYESLAKDANPLLLHIRATATKLKEISGDAAAASGSVIEACKSADDDLWLLRKLPFDGDLIKEDFKAGDPLVTQVAAWLLDDRPLYCRPDNGDPNRIQMCTKWCRDDWDDLVKAVTRVRSAAEKEGVDIVSIAPGS